MNQVKPTIGPEELYWIPELNIMVNINELTNDGRVDDSGPQALIGCSSSGPMPQKESLVRTVSNDAEVHAMDGSLIVAAVGYGEQNQPVCFFVQAFSNQDTEITMTDIKSHVQAVANKKLSDEILDELLKEEPIDAERVIAAAKGNNNAKETKKVEKDEVA